MSHPQLLCAVICLLVLELEACAPTSLSSTGQCGGEIISETSRSAWGRSIVMAAPQWRPNYFCLLSFYQIIYSPGDPAEALEQGTHLQDLTCETERLIWGYMLKLTNKQMILDTSGLSPRLKIRCKNLPVYCTAPKQILPSHTNINHCLCSVNHEQCFYVKWLLWEDNVTECMIWINHVQTLHAPVMRQKHSHYVPHFWCSSCTIIQ